MQEAAGGRTGVSRKLGRLFGSPRHWVAIKAKRVDETAQKEWAEKGIRRESEERETRKLEGKGDKEKGEGSVGTRGQECFKKEGMANRSRLLGQSVGFSNEKPFSDLDALVGEGGVQGHTGRGMNEGSGKGVASPV